MFSNPGGAKINCIKGSTKPFGGKTRNNLGPCQPSCFLNHITRVIDRQGRKAIPPGGVRFTNVPPFNQVTIYKLNSIFPQQTKHLFLDLGRFAYTVVCET